MYTVVREIYSFMFTEWHTNYKLILVWNPLLTFVFFYKICPNGFMLPWGVSVSHHWWWCDWVNFYSWSSVNEWIQPKQFDICFQNNKTQIALERIHSEIKLLWLITYSANFRWAIFLTVLCFRHFWKIRYYLS